MSRQATVIVADDATYSLSGKLNIIGAYATDITIPNIPTVATQLVFVFIVETEPDDPYKHLAVRVELPSGDARQLQLPLHTFVSGEADKIRWCVKYPMLFQAPILTPGPIVTSAIHENGMILTAAPVIIFRPPIVAQLQANTPTSAAPKQ
jgi:hypothetical protein